ncbi:hypothetical protein H4R18_001287 [Coemansia javaensis]|uniref:Uncharacterized protein n=1 Tax=Coemansia javaensis TaxID=2761396 RepID=A0A9W8HK61_9FUNG|nr:hypothetical protein H4R18_001287 [Coemansia javaensis]
MLGAARTGVLGLARLARAGAQLRRMATGPLGTNVHYTETLEDGSVFVARVPRTLPAVSEADLPPRVREPAPAPAAHVELTDQLRHAVAKLRAEDPAHWTVSRLAKKFGLPPHLVMRIAQCPAWRRHEIQQAADSEWARLGYKKRLIRLNRLRRRLLW